MLCSIFLPLSGSHLFFPTLVSSTSSWSPQYMNRSIFGERGLSWPPSSHGTGELNRIPEYGGTHNAVPSGSIHFAP